MKRPLLMAMLLAVALFSGCRKEETPPQKSMTFAEQMQYRRQLLDDAQAALAHTDSLLQLAERRYQSALQRLRTDYSDATADSLALELTHSRLERDSLKVCWQTQGGRVRYLLEHMDDLPR